MVVNMRILSKKKEEKIINNDSNYKYEDIFPWEEFLDRYLENHEEFAFHYKGKRIWLVTGKNDFAYTMLPIAAINVLTIELVQDLLSTLCYDGKQLMDVWDNVNIYQINTFSKSTKDIEELYIKGSYCDFLSDFITNKKRFKIVYNGNISEIYHIRDLHDNNLKIGVCTYFNSPEDLLENARFFGKTLKDIWDSLK